MRQQTAGDGTSKKQQGGGGAAVALDVGKSKEVLVGEEVAVDAGEDDAGQGVVAQGPAGDGLGTALEGDEGERQEDGPVDGILAGGWGAGDDEGGGDGQGHLGGKGGAEDPAALGGEEVVEAGEEKGADAKGEQRDAGAVQTGGGGRENEGSQAEADVDGVSCERESVGRLGWKQRQTNPSAWRQRRPRPASRRYPAGR